MKIFKFILAFYLLFFQSDLYSNETDFNKWLSKFKIVAKNEGISDKTINIIMNKAIFLPKVIEYDRYQP